MQATVIDLVPLPQSNPPIDAGAVRALAAIRCAGSIVIRDCRLIQQHDGSLRLYGPQVRQVPPGSEALLCRTFVDWPEVEAIRLGKMAATRMNNQVQEGNA
ncbi:MAG: hypothetical protein V4671_05485 [Armatimonadota bacterium]